MGVQGLWDLLAPVGRRVSVETLAGKRLAIDASIWMVQFMKAMRDERGEMVRNAHLLGFFRRICKLLYLRSKPVFVFDGGTPALKRRTVIARRRQRENAQAKIRKTAEKLLLNHLKAMRLEDLAKDLEKQRKNQKNDDKGKKIATEQAHGQDSDINQEHNIEYPGTEINNQKSMDEMLAASLAYEEDRHLNYDGSTATVVPDPEQADSEENEDIIWPARDGSVDPTVLASLPKAMQLDFMRRNRSTMDNGKNKEVKDGKQNDNAKGKEVLSDQMDMLERDNVIAKSYNQEELDEMLAACIAAEERQSLTKIASTSGAQIPWNLDDDDEDEEMILPAFSGKVDPAILAALPPSVQLDLLVQMRERLMAENRQKYQKVKKAPEKFSELQIEAYLKTVNFRREINQVQRAAAGKDVGGVQTSRIASEANKEFIFSSSFTGDKQLLTSAGVQRNGENSSNSVDQIASTSKSTTVTAFVQDESGKVFDEDVETYVDERGRVRVSRVRAMGMRMTRDLQRNLDLMKEIELERTPPTMTASARPELLGHEIGSQKSIPSKEHDAELSHDNNANSVKLNDRNAHSILNDESSIQISFEVDCESQHAESDDDIFTSLVAGQPVKVSSNSASDSDWEEGIVDRDGGCSKDVTVGTNAFLQESNANYDSEVEWEEEGCDVHENYKPSRELGKAVSKGDLVEESDLQEAIRRSLEDFRGEDICDRRSSEVTHRDVKFLDSKDNTGKINLLEEDKNQQNKSFGEIMATAKHDGLNTKDSLHICSSSQRKIHISESHDTDNQGILTAQSSPPDLDLDDGQPTLGNSAVKDLSSDSIEDKDIAMSVDRPMDTSSEDVKICLGNVSVLNTVSSEMNFSTSVDSDDNDMKIDGSALSNEKKIPEATFHVVELTKDSRTPVEPVLEGEKNPVQSNENEHFMDKVSNNEKEQCMDEFSNNENLQADFSEAELQEEILSLDQERITLGREQKKLERNAESVSSEMFAECQELLQMFGIPYIIAPMEAEAQCAYMELANLVDGVVTDDSDVFLFGGQSVYKNIFDDRKYVETYLMKDIEKELGLTREKLVHMALLLGSDYTEGISGIGIVNAIEVVNAFPEEDGLQKFREWIESPDPNILGKFYANSQACGQESSSDHNQEMKQIFMKKHRNVSKNWHVPSSFPSEAVISAYFCPQVDKSTDPFTWGKPDIHVLRKHCWDKFGWAAQKSDELLMPVLKEYNKHETQLRLEAFYSFNERFAKIRSKRIKKAVKGITGNHLSEVMDDLVEGSSRSRKKRTNVSGESGDVTEKPSKRGKQSACSLQTDSLGKTTEKQSRKRKTGGSVSSDVENRKKSQQLNTDCESGKRRGGGHRRGRGRGRGRGRRGRGKGKESFDVELCDSSSVESSSGDDDVEVCVKKPEASKELRRSTRTRKAANYVQNDSDIDDVDKSPDLNGKKSGEEAIEQSGSVTVEGAGNNTSKSQNSQEHHNIDGPLPEDYISRDYLEMGGGFVNEEDESGEGLDNYPGSTEDYLKMGGGFCLNESEAAAEQDPADASCFSSLMEQDDSVKNPDQETLCEDLGKRISSDANSGLDCSTTDSVSLPKDTESNSAMPSLTAMPFLKRKRRQS